MNESPQGSKRYFFVDFFKQVPLFEDLSQGDLRRLARILHERTYRDGEYIFEEGKPCTRCTSCEVASLRS